MSSDGIPNVDASWRTVLAPHVAPRLRPALLDVATSVVPYVGLMVAMFVAFRISYLLVLVLAIPAAGFLVRTFIVFHDCAHGSFVRSKRANATLGAALGVVLLHALCVVAPRARGPPRDRRRPRQEGRR